MCRFKFSRTFEFPDWEITRPGSKVRVFRSAGPVIVEANTPTYSEEEVFADPRLVKRFANLFPPGVIKDYGGKRREIGQR